MELKLYLLMAAVVVIIVTAVWFIVMLLRGMKQGGWYSLVGGLIGLGVGYVFPPQELGFLALNAGGFSHVIELSFAEVRAVIGLAIGLVGVLVVRVAFASKRYG